MRHRHHLATAILVLALSAPAYAQVPLATQRAVSASASTAASGTIDAYKAAWLRDHSTSGSPETFGLLTSSQSPQPQRQVRRTKAALIGMAIGGGIGTAIGANMCRADCGGGMPRGALFVGLAGAGIGAGGGLLIALFGEPWP